MKRVYLDNAASTPVLPSVKRVVIETMESFGNPSATHAEGRQAKAIIEKARAEVAELIGAKPSEIIFTSGGSESNNMIINTFWGQRVVISAIEHASIVEPFLRGAGKKISYGNVLPVDKFGRVKISILESIFSDKKIQSKPALVSVMLANNEIGVIQDISKIAKITHTNGALLHTDATQAIGKIPVNVDDLGVDYLTLSAAKIGGIKGVGALYVREGSPIKPLILGGHQQNGLRAGTENVVGIAALGAAAKHASTNLDKYYLRVGPLGKKLLEGIIREIPEVTINGDPKNCLPGILNISFAGVEGESAMLMLDAVGIAVSTGSACATPDIKSSHVLTAINIDPELAHNALRFSLGAETTTADIDYVLKKLPPIIDKLRKMSDIKEKQ